jgi:hypothetical protein
MQSPPNLIIHNQPWETFFAGKLNPAQEEHMAKSPEQKAQPEALATFAAAARTKAPSPLIRG